MFVIVATASWRGFPQYCFMQLTICCMNTPEFARLIAFSLSTALATDADGAQSRVPFGSPAATFSATCRSLCASRLSHSSDRFASSRGKSGRGPDGDGTRCMGLSFFAGRRNAEPPLPSSQQVRAN